MKGLRGHRSGAQLIGDSGERRAENFLVQEGWRILARNWSCRSGELDLVCELADRTVVFVEVRYRSCADYGAAQETVGYSKQNRLVKTALLFLKSRGMMDRSVRFDVAAVTPTGIEHIPNAFSSSLYFL